MLFKTLDQIREKPKSVRDQYALGFAVCFTVLVGGVWSLSLPARFSQSAAVGNATTTESSAFAGLIDQFKNQFKSAKAVIGTFPTASTTSPSPSSVVATTSVDDPRALQLSDENKAELQNSSSSTSTTPMYGMGNAPATQTIMIATSSTIGTSTE